MVRSNEQKKALLLLLNDQLLCPLKRDELVARARAARPGNAQSSKVRGGSNKTGLTHEQRNWLRTVVGQEIWHRFLIILDRNPSK